MHPFLFQLLADRDNSGKPIFIALVIAIWIIGSIVSSIRKATATRQVQKEKASLRATRQAMQIPAVAQSRPKLQPAKIPVKRSAKRRPPPIPKKVPAPPPREPEPIMMQVAESGPSHQSQQATARPGPARGVTAAALNRWLNPRTLRQQFILTELLQPPLALREERTLI